MGAILMSETIELIDLDKITPSKGNRAIGGFDQDKLENLAESIKAVGVQQPAVVRVMGDGFELVAGERRWRASRLAGLSFLPCVVRDLTDDQLLKIQVIENLQREDVHPLDEADGYERLRTEGGYDPELIAHEVGKSLTYVYQRLRLLKLCDEARILLVEGKISVAVAILLARLGEDQQRLVIKAMLQDWQLNIGVSACSINNWISSNIMLEMSKAAWKMTDATLVKKAGSCSECLKRTGSDPALFDDITNDHCTDGACYKSKQKAIVERNLKSLEGKDFLVVRVDYGNPQPAGSLAPYEWTEVKKKDEGALPAIVINGESPGRLTYAIKKAASKSSPSWTGEEDPEEIAEQEAEEKRQTARKNTNKKLFEAVIEACRNSQSQITLLHQMAKREFERGSCTDELAEWYGLIANVENEGDEDPLETAVFDAIDIMGAKESVTFLLALKISRALDPPTWGDVITDSIVPYLELYRIDGEEIRAAEYAAVGAELEKDEPEEDDDQTDEPEAEESEADETGEDE